MEFKELMRIGAENADTGINRNIMEFKAVDMKKLTSTERELIET